MNQAIFSMDGEALASSRKEQDNNYRAVVIQFNDEWRLIECRSGIQWILQYSKKTRFKTQWHGRSYHRTSESLKRVIHSLKVEISPIAQSILDQLPPRFVETTEASQ